MTQVTELKGLDTVASADFDYAAAISNTTAVAGAPGFSKAAGRAYVFTNTATGWKQAAKLKVSDTTVRERRDEWIAAGVFETIANEAISGYDRIIGLDLSDVALDAGLHKSPCGGGGTGKNRPIGPSSDGSGRSSPTRSGSPSVGPQTAPTATTRSF